MERVRVLPWSLLAFIAVELGLGFHFARTASPDGAIEASPLGMLASIELTKLAALPLLARRRRAGEVRAAPQPRSAHELLADAPPSRSARPAKRSPAWLAVAVLGLLYALRPHVILEVGRRADTESVAAAEVYMPTLSALLLWCFGLPMSPQYAYAVMLQLCAMLMVQRSTAAGPLQWVTAFALWAYISVPTTMFVGIELAHHDSADASSIIRGLFTISSALSSCRWLFEFVKGRSARFSSSTAALVLAYASRDLLALRVIDAQDSTTMLLAASSCTTLLKLHFGAQETLLFNLFLGCASLLLSLVIFAHSRSELARTMPRISHRVLGAAILITPVMLTLVSWRTYGGPPADFRRMGPATSQLVLLPHAQCHRTIKTLDTPFHKFADVLLVVPIQRRIHIPGLVDRYRDLYGPYFPNILFMGHEPRKDAGFEGSFDIVVDTYRSDNSNGRLPGRMLHHMLYRALVEHPCYEGYLWAAPDVFLNAPRLAGFSTERAWFASPFAEFVPSAHVPPHHWALWTSHAAPALISPDTPENLTAGWAGWEADWWWGNSEFGLRHCRPAFDAAPAALRAALARRTGGAARFVGGEADVLFIPRRLRTTLISLLALFLETECFVDIALPTALHLALAGEAPLFLDLWFAVRGADYVREQWLAGKEVDAFHDFQWDTGNPNADPARILLESAFREGIRAPEHLYTQFAAGM